MTKAKPNTQSGGTRKTAYFSDGLDAELLTHAERFGNFSNYIKRLIALDMERGLLRIPKRKAVPQSLPQKPEPTRTETGGIRIDFGKPSIYDVAQRKKNEPDSRI